jgi:hypothetical protein
MLPQLRRETLPSQPRKFTPSTQLTGRILPTTTPQASEPLSTTRRTLSGELLPSSFNLTPNGCELKSGNKTHNIIIFKLKIILFITF